MKFWAPLFALAGVVSLMPQTSFARVMECTTLAYPQCQEIPGMAVHLEVTGPQSFQVSDQTKYIYDSEHSNMEIWLSGHRLYFGMLDGVSQNHAPAGSIPAGHDTFSLEISAFQPFLVPGRQDQITVGHNGMGCSSDATEYEVTKEDVTELKTDHDSTGPFYDIKNLELKFTRSSCDHSNVPTSGTLSVYRK